MVDTSTARRYDLMSRAAGMADAQWRLVAQAAIPPGATVLEIGAGTGTVALLAARAVPTATVTGIDPDGVALAAAAAKADAAGLTVRFDEGRAGLLPYADASVDRVLSSLMFHHLAGDERLAALREVHRVLKPGGSVHLLDLTEGRPLPFTALWHRLLGGRGGRRPDPGHGDQGHGHGGHGHGGHGHGGHGDPASELVPLLARAGLRDATEVGHGRSRFGGLTYYRADR